MTRARSLSQLANSNIFTVDSTNSRVGIGSTIPDVKLDVDGNMNVSGTLTYEDVTNVETAGITTTGGLVVTGLGATIGGITTFFGDINFGGAGVGGTVTTLGHGGFTGIVTALGFQATGVITATSFRGDGSQLSGVDSSNLVDSGDTNRVAANTSGIVVTGITTTTDSVKAADGHVELLLDSGNGRIKLNSSGDVTNIDLFGSNGSATFKGDLTIADKIIHDGDTNTAIRFPAADTVTVETAGSEALRVNSNQRLLVGHTAQRGIGQLEIEGTSFENSGLTLVRNVNSTGGTSLNICKTRGSKGSTTSVQDDDVLGGINFRGADGANLRDACDIRGEVDGSPSQGTDMPGRLVFRTSAEGSSSPTERLRISSDGQIGMGIASPTQESGIGLHIRGADGGQSRIHLTNSATGDTATDGFYIISQGAESGGASGEVMLQQKENKSLKFATNNTERLRIGSSGQIGIGGANYGTSGQVLTSNGSGSAVTWEDASGGGISTQAGTASGIVTSMFLTDATDHKVTATGICTITTTQAGTEGESHTIRIVNSGIATVGFSTYFLFPSGSAPSLPTANGAVSLISFTVHDSVGAGCTQLLAGASVNFS